MAEFNLDTIVDERGAEAWANIVETLIEGNRFEDLFGLLIVERNDEDFPRLLKRALLGMHECGINSGRAEVIKAVLATVPTWPRSRNAKS